MMVKNLNPLEIRVDHLKDTICGVRLTHIPTGIKVFCNSSNDSQLENRQIALSRLLQLVPDCYEYNPK